MRTAIPIQSEFYVPSLRKGIYLVLLHPDKIPPHIGLMIDHSYHSLTIKGRELDIGGKVLVKNISLRKIPALFIKLAKHPVFSTDYMNQCFLEQVKAFERVDGIKNTCLAPVRLFFEEFYSIDKSKIHLVFDLLEELYSNEFIETVSGTNLGPLNENIFYLQPYNAEYLERRIREEIQSK